MNYRQRMKRGKKQHGTKKCRKVWKHVKKVRGKRNRHERMVKVNIVTSDHVYVQTSFAAYKIPRKSIAFFQEASQHELQHVEFYKVQTFQFECGYDFVFNWYDLDVTISVHFLKKHEISKQNELPIKDESWKEVHLYKES